jgi:hypothetical protein
VMKNTGTFHVGCKVENHKDPKVAAGPVVAA